MTAEEYNRLGMSYYYGDDGEIDLLRSAYYYEKAAIYATNTSLVLFKTLNKKIRMYGRQKNNC